MALDVKFYDAASIILGGAKGSLLGAVNGTGDQSATAAQFAGVTSEVASGATNYYFRKVWLTNEEVVDIEDPEIYFDDLEYPDQITFAREKSADDVTTDPYAMPSGYETSDFLTAVAAEDRVALKADSSDFAASANEAIWIRIKVPPGQVADPSAAGRIRLRGRKAS